MTLPKGSDPISNDEMAVLLLETGVSGPENIRALADAVGTIGGDFTPDQIAAINGAAAPSVDNTFATMDDVPVFTADELDAVAGAAAPSVDNVFATMADMPAGTMTADEAAAVAGAAAPSADNVFATIADLPVVPDPQLSADELAAATGADTPSAGNPFATISDLPVVPDPQLSTDELAAVTGAAAPDAGNVFATMADVGGGGGGGSWPWTEIVKAHDDHVTSSSTDVADSELSFVPVDGGVYRIEGELAYSGGGGLQWVLGHPAADGYIETWLINGGGNLDVHQDRITAPSYPAMDRVSIEPWPTTDKRAVWFRALLALRAGTAISVLFAQGTPSATALNLLTGSTLRYRRIA